MSADYYGNYLETAISENYELKLCRKPITELAGTSQQQHEIPVEFNLYKSTEKETISGHMSVFSEQWEDRKVISIGRRDISSSNNEAFLLSKITEVLKRMRIRSDFLPGYVEATVAEIHAVLPADHPAPYHGARVAIQVNIYNKTVEKFVRNGNFVMAKREHEARMTENFERRRRANWATFAQDMAGSEGWDRREYMATMEFMERSERRIARGIGMARLKRNGLELWHDGDAEECAICLEGFELFFDAKEELEDDEEENWGNWSPKEQGEAGFEGIRLPCSHVYHKDCILMWLEKHETCPSCRHRTQYLVD